MQGMGKHVKVALIQPPARIVNFQTLDGCYALPFDRLSPPPLDHAKKRRAQADIGNAARLLRPAWQWLIAAHHLNGFLKIRQGLLTEGVSVVFLHTQITRSCEWLVFFSGLGLPALCRLLLKTGPDQFCETGSCPWPVQTAG